MSARGLLQNPALFLGFKRTPLECVIDWIKIATSQGAPFHNIHQHLMFMFFKVHSKIGTSYNNQNTFQKNNSLNISNEIGLVWFGWFGFELN
jgi:hypothetical protein